MEDLGILRFEEGYFERIWGGQKLRTLFGKPIPADKPIGEAWLVADHPAHESVVAEGPHRGRTLHQLLQEDAAAVLGTRAELTIHGRFPLMLKILDAREALSVQVHPDDACAKASGEPDVGKTEMWHVLQADPNSELICGLNPTITSEMLEQAMAQNPKSPNPKPQTLDPRPSLEALMRFFPAEEGVSVFVPAGTVHAIGAGIVLAEIQQNSDLTYRVYDWNRVDAAGQARELHIEKALRAVHFGSKHGGPSHTQQYRSGNAICTVLAKCQYFAAELVQVQGSFQREKRRETFHIILATKGHPKLAIENDQCELTPGQAAFIPGSVPAFDVAGNCAFLDYYIPNPTEIDARC